MLEGEILSGIKSIYVAILAYLKVKGDVSEQFKIVG